LYLFGTFIYNNPALLAPLAALKPAIPKPSADWKGEVCGADAAVSVDDPEGVPE
jgi:hypothetical protein